MDTDERYKQKLSLFDQKLYEIGLKNADFIIAQNQYQCDNLKRKFPRKKITVIYNPFKIYRNNINNFKRDYIAWVGIFQRQKNLGGLLQIVKACPDLKFKVAGREDLSGNDIDTENSLRELRCQKNVEFAGFLKRNDINDFLSKAYCLLNTSHHEGFSNTFLEAWSVGTPVVTTKNIDPDHVIEKNNLGLVADVHEELPIKIRELVNNANFEKYSLNTYKYVKEHHNPKFLAKKFIEFVL